MSIQDWGAVGEIIGGIAIIVSLIYVAVQVRHSNKSSRSTAMQSFASQYASVMLASSYPHISGLHVKGMHGLDQLDLNERVMYMAWLVTVYRSWESFFFQYVEGTMEKALFDALMRQALDLHATKGATDFWELRKHQFTPAFVSYLERTFNSASVHDLYE